MTTEVGEKATVLKLVVNTVTRSCDNNGDIISEEITMSPVYSDKEGSVNKQAVVEVDPLRPTAIHREQRERVRANPAGPVLHGRADAVR